MRKTHEVCRSEDDLSTTAWVFHISLNEFTGVLGFPHMYSQPLMFPHLGYGCCCPNFLPIAVSRRCSWIQRIVSRTLFKNEKHHAPRGGCEGAAVSAGCRLYREKKQIFSSENPHVCPIPMFSGEDQCFWLSYMVQYGTVLYHREIH